MSAEISVALGTDDGPGPLADSDVVFLPVAPDGDAPVYPGIVPQLITELRETGVSARTWHPEGRSEFVSDRGPFADALLQIVVGIASSGGWHAIQSILRRRRGRVRVVAVYDQDGRRCRAEATGTAADVADALTGLDPFRSEPSA